MWSALAAAFVFGQQYSTTSLRDFAAATAIEYHLNKSHFLATINCESQFQYDVLGDDGASVGIAQIDLDFHPDVSYAAALNPAWSIVWMANEWQHDRASEWSCWKQLYT